MLDNKDNKMNIEELCKYIEADSLAFISEEGLKKIYSFFKRTYMWVMYVLL